MKVSRILLGVVFVAGVLAVMPLGARQPASAAGQAEKKETKWQGHVVRIYKDTSMMDLRGPIRSAGARSWRPPATGS